MRREYTRPIKLKNLTLGGNNHIYIQSMCNIRTSKTDEVISQIKALEAEGCEIIRVSVLDVDDAKAIKEIVNNINIPLVADIHFSPEYAIVKPKNVEAISYSSSFNNCYEPSDVSKCSIISFTTFIYRLAAL
jgi:(E)-4-hydroxy-3-methylbut-2-enyl-diphosphate synthase